MHMTPEERFTRIENFLSTVAEHQAHIAEQQAQMLGHQSRHDKEIQDLRQMQKSMTLAITKVADAHRATEEAQKITEQKLNALIDTVDRIIRSQGDQTP